MRPLGKGGGILIPRIQICRLGFFGVGRDDDGEATPENPNLITMMRPFNPSRHGAIGVGGSKFVIVASVPFGGWGRARGKFVENSGGNLKVSF